ncbi:hypothetical protein [Streptomyces lasiicapitis]|uniref:hypothetical protein n=1 Tax=Streptomyces lasiicapitis TaxID=1923961 RepID=UPI0036CB56EF
MFDALPGQPTPEQVRATRARIEEITSRTDNRARQPVLAYLAGFAWAFVVFLLCVAEFIARFWLARPDASAERGQAVFSLTLGMFWVVLQPLVRLTPAPIVPMVRALRGYRRLARFEREIGQGEPEGER